MPKYSKSHERAECAKMSRGLWESLFGLIFSWLPGVGLILSVVGFCRQAVRLTEAHKVRRLFSMAFASVVLVAAIGGLVGEAYLYSRNPDILNTTSLWVWQKVTGQQALPGADNGEAVAGDTGDASGDASVDVNVPDEYHTADGQTEEGDVPAADSSQAQGSVPPDNSQGGGQMEEGDVPVTNNGQAEGDFQDNVNFTEDNSDDTANGGGAPSATLPPLGDLLKSHGAPLG